MDKPLPALTLSLFLVLAIAEAAPLDCRGDEKPAPDSKGRSPDHCLTWPSAPFAMGSDTIASLPKPVSDSSSSTRLSTICSLGIPYTH